MFLKAEDAVSVDQRAAHEIGHIFGLHDSETDTTNLMYKEVLHDENLPFPARPYHKEFSRQIWITKEQMDTMKAFARTRGKNTEHGSWVDSWDSTIKSYVDLVSGQFFAENMDSDLVFSIQLGEPSYVSNIRATYECFLIWTMMWVLAQPLATLQESTRNW